MATSRGRAWVTTCSRRSTLLGVEQIDVFGHSLGGAALLIAESVRPGLLRSAFFFEPIVMTEEYLTGRTNLMSDAARRRREVFPSRADALMRYASRTPLGVWRADALAAYVEHGFEDLPDGTVRLKCRPESEARTFECETKMTLERIEGFAVPTVVAVGSEEPTGAMFGQPDRRRHGERPPRSYPHLGHFGPLQDPASIGADVLAAATSIRA